MGLRGTAVGRGRLLIPKVVLVCCYISILASVSVNGGNGGGSSGAGAFSSDVRSWRRRSIYEVDGAGRRRLMGPGSYPPRCTKRCGKCTPCRPVHVPVPPQAPVINDGEYYPESWRCKCRNRLY